MHQARSLTPARGNSLTCRHRFHHTAEVFDLSYGSKSPLFDKTNLVLCASNFSAAPAVMFSIQISSANKVRSTKFKARSILKTLRYTLQMDTTHYLQRLNYKGSTSPTAETLRQLHLAHLQTVPFENLSMHSDEPIVLEDEALFEKIVMRRRGGFCYELNGLFAGLLRSLGFNVVKLSARVANAKGEFGPEFDHMTLMVTAPDAPQTRWLADVGFGDCFNEPLLFDSREAQQQGLRAYRIDAADDHFVLIQREGEGEWQPQYRFTLAAHEYPDYAEMCQYHQTSPQSHFTKARVCTRITPEGRITLSELRFITTAKGERQERMLDDEGAYQLTLREQFGIEMTGLKPPSRQESQSSPRR